MSITIAPFYCSFCGEQIKVDEGTGEIDEDYGVAVGGTGELIDATSIRFQSPFPRCKELVACNTCRTKYEGKKSDQYFCNLCGKQITNVEVLTVKAFAKK